MPSFGDWLRASWDDYRRRWAVLLAVAAAGGTATLLAGFLPVIPAALATAFGAGPAWAAWGLATALSTCGVLWFSTWGQAALMRAALTEEGAGDCLSRAWGQTAAFAWVLSLALLAVAGGYFLLIVPGMILSVMLFAAPFCQVSGEADGVRALGLSWARVKPRFGAVALRMLAATVLTAAPGWIPYAGWIIMMFWAPFGFVALARLDRDLRAADPDAAPPDWMGGAVAGLSAAFILGTFLACALALRAATAALQRFNEPGGLASRVRPETAQALLAAFAGDSSDAEKERLVGEFWTEVSSAPRSSP
jgi:hypothetical protein